MNFKKLLQLYKSYRYRFLFTNLMSTVTITGLGETLSTIRSKVIATGVALLLAYSVIFTIL